MKRNNETDEEYNARKREEYAANPGKHTARKQQWRDANREQYRAIGRKFANSEHGQKSRKEWRDSHPENIRAATARYKADMTPEQRKLTAQKHRDNPITKLKHCLGEARKRAIDMNLPFEEALYAVLDSPPTHCACCGHVLDYNVRGRGCRNFGPSIDRVINSEGYTIRNVRWVCGYCNARKSDSTREMLAMFIAYIDRNTSS